MKLKGSSLKYEVKEGCKRGVRQFLSCKNISGKILLKEGHILEYMNFGIHVFEKSVTLL